MHTSINHDGLQPFSGASAWQASQLLEHEELWRFKLSHCELCELEIFCDELIVDKCISDDKSSIILSRIFDKIETAKELENLNKLIDALLEHLIFGIGFSVLSGIPVLDWGYEKSAIAFIVLSRLMGTLRKQNAKCHVLGHVTNLGLQSSDPNVRVYQTNERQTFHTDSCDVVALLCLQPAIEGGISAVVSSETIFNEILKSKPELLHELFKPLPTDRRGEIPPDMLPYYEIPVFSYYHGHLTSIYQRQYIDSSQRFDSAPRLEAKTIEALDLFDSHANDPLLHISIKLTPGDIQFVHNHNMLHDRTAFIDDPANKRHLLRIWIAPLIGRPLPSVFSERFGSVEVGNRGGVNVSDAEDIASLIW